MGKSSMPTILLIDNGSICAGATLKMRQIAEQLSDVSNLPIHPVSLRHADKIDAGKLQDVPAQTLTPFLDAKLSAGEREFIILPLFFGVGRALTSFVPDQLALLKEKHGDFELDLADVIYPLPAGEPRLVTILQEHITQTSYKRAVELTDVVLLDHGSPEPQITQVRENIVAGLQETLSPAIKLEQAVMERREGEEYDFNGPLLEQWLSNKVAQGVEQIMVVLLFFLPGRHAGPGGDIETICKNALQQYPDLCITLTPLIGEHPMLISILHSRLKDCLNISEP